MLSYAASLQLLLAALSNLDREQLEPASLDGASALMVFCSIVLPAIMPVMVIAILIRGLDLFRVFDVMWTMTQGGPGTPTEAISVHTFELAFREFDLSYSAAIAFLVIVSLMFVAETSFNPIIRAHIDDELVGKRA